MRFARMVTSALGLLVASAGMSQTNMTMQISTPDPMVRAGSRIPIVVIISNNSNEVVTYADRRSDCDYRIFVLDRRGLPAPETDFKRSLNCNGGLPMSARNIQVTLKPGEKRKETLEVTRLYQLSAPNKYSVQVDRHFPEVGDVLSNKLLVTIE